MSFCLGATQTLFFFSGDNNNVFKLRNYLLANPVWCISFFIFGIAMRISFEEIIDDATCYDNKYCITSNKNYFDYKCVYVGSAISKTYLGVSLGFIAQNISMCIYYHIRTRGLAVIRSVSVEGGSNSTKKKTNFFSRNQPLHREIPVCYPAFPAKPAIVSVEFLNTSLDTTLNFITH